MSENADILSLQELNVELSCLHCMCIIYSDIQENLLNYISIPNCKNVIFPLLFPIVIIQLFFPSLCSVPKQGPSFKLFFNILDIT